MSRQAGDQQGGREAVPVRYRARVEYDGTDFAGFQVQPGARTVQGELEAALARVSGGSPTGVSGRSLTGVSGRSLTGVSGRSLTHIVAAGRTDAGVHATGQVIAFTYSGRLPADELERALDALLPLDVAIRDLRTAPAEFHPRFAARYREYRYTVWNGPRSPLRERTALGVRVPLDTAAMARAGSVFVGRHDFTAFGVADRQPVRTVHAVRVRRNGSLVTIDVSADSFLGHMVRRIVGALLEVGHGRLDSEALAAALASKDAAVGGATAPAKGLCLRRVVLGRPARQLNGER